MRYVRSLAFLTPVLAVGLLTWPRLLNGIPDWRVPVIGFLIAFAVVVLVFWGISSVNGGRLRAAQTALPGAFVVPIVVGHDTQQASWALGALLGDSRVNMASPSYGALAFDQRGVYVVRGRGSEILLIPADVLEIGIGKAESGPRMLRAIVARIAVRGEVIDLPFIPMRVRGNWLRWLKPGDLESIRHRITEALAGRAPVEAWNY